MTTPDNERRRFTRIDFDASTELQKGDHLYMVTLVDISFNGILVKSDTPLKLALGDEALATIRLQGDDVAIRTPVILTHQNEQEYGFLIENLDLDSLTLLRRLVELNLGDPTLLERELDHFFATDAR
ncbi:PilZ domain-containing protein [Neptuniibacter pectenicola]|uniref:PilZ domain-containing protein n=1 Tax=Neptuniibacter pectenicola TaxID=1806669 RepID=UPI00082B13F0|nr:PilZ domain-containing protein [Neptuniibacter pectenicola]